METFYGLGLLVLKFSNLFWFGWE